MTTTASTRQQRGLPPSLRFPGFRLLVGGQAVSRIGNSIYEGTLGLMVFAVGSAITMSTVLIAFVAPQLLLGIKAGVLSDRLDRRRLLIAADLLAAVVAGAVAVAVAVGSGRPAPALLIVLSLGIGTAAALFNPVYGPLLSHTVPAEHLASANALDAAVANAVTLAAPALGGALYATAGAAWALGANSASFLIAAICTGLLRLPPEATRPPTAPYQQTEPPAGEELTAAAALHYVRSSGWLPPLLGLAMLMNLLVLGPFFVMLPWRVASQRLPAVTLGMAVSIQAGAALLASLIIGRFPPARPGRRLAHMATAFPVALLVLFLPGMPGVLLAAALAGTGMASGVLENLMLQTWVPDRLRGRVYSFDMLVSMCAIPFGYLIAGAAIDASTAKFIAGAGAGLCLAAAGWAAASPLGRHDASAAEYAGA